MEPIPQLALLQKFLCQVLDVAFGEVHRGSNGDGGTRAADGNGLAELPSLAIDFEFVVQEGLLYEK